MGLRPDLVGKGLGREYVQSVVRYGATQYNVKHLRVTISEFNKRAQRVWEHLGFQQVERFIKFDSETEFVVMTCNVNALV